MVQGMVPALWQDWSQEKEGMGRKRAWAQWSPWLFEDWKATKAVRCKFLLLMFLQVFPVENQSEMVAWNQVRDSLVTTQSCAPEDKKLQRRPEEYRGEKILSPWIWIQGEQAGFVLLGEVSFFSASDWDLLFFSLFFPLNSFKRFLNFHQSVMWSPYPGSEESLNWDLQIKSANCTSQQQKGLTWTRPLNNESLPNNQVLMERISWMNQLLNLSIHTEGRGQCHFWINIPGHRKTGS